MKFDYLLFDADDTLLDFKRSEIISLEIVFQKNNIFGDFSQLLISYQQINDRLWEQNAAGEISKDFLKIERFKKFLDENKLKASPEKMCQDYLDTLPNQVYLISGALELLKSLYGKIPLIIVTNGIGITQQQRLINSGLKPYIDLMVVSEDCGFAKPDSRIFHYTFEKLNLYTNRPKALMVGDKLETDILGAQNVGIESCWFNPENKTNHTPISPTYTIEDLSEVLNLI